MKMATAAIQSELLPTLTQGGHNREYQNPTGGPEVSMKPTNQKGLAEAQLNIKET